MRDYRNNSRADKNINLRWKCLSRTRLGKPRIGFTAWLSIVALMLLPLAFALSYAFKKGYVNKGLFTSIGITMVAFVVLVRLINFVRFIRTEGKKDIREFFFFKSAREEGKELELEERIWKMESDSRPRLDSRIKSKIQSLEMAYVRNTCAKTTLSLARAYEECGLQDIAQLCYDLLLHKFRWSKEARAFRKAYKKNANRLIGVKPGGQT